VQGPSIVLNLLSYLSVGAAPLGTRLVPLEALLASPSLKGEGGLILAEAYCLCLVPTPEEAPPAALSRGV